MDEVLLTQAEVAKVFRLRGLPAQMFYAFCDDAGFTIAEDGGEEFVRESDLIDWLNG
jgi:hypothetical protein